MCERISLPLMDMPRNKMFEVPIRKRQGFEKWVRPLQLRQMTVTALHKLHEESVARYPFMSFIAGGQAWNYLSRTHKAFKLPEPIQRAAVSFSNMGVTFISGCSKTQEFKSFVLWIYEKVILSITQQLKASFLCKEDNSFCFQLYLNDKLFDDQKINIYDPVKCKVDFDAYEFVIYLTHNRYRINQTLFKFDFWNVYSPLPSTWFRDKTKEFVTSNYMLNEFGLALFNTILGEFRAEEKGFAVDLLRRELLKDYLIERGDLGTPPTDIDIRHDYGFYNYYMMIQKKYISLFQDTEAFSSHMVDHLYSLALKTIPEIKECFDAIEEEYVLLLRAHINAFVVYLSKVAKQYNIHNTIGISGGDAYRRWTDTVTKTADIDTKLLVPFEQPNLNDRVEQELVLLSLYMKNILFSPQNEHKPKVFEIMNKYTMTFNIPKTEFRLRRLEMLTSHVTLLSVDLRCSYTFKDKRYMYSISILDVPILDTPPYTKKYGYDPTKEFVRFPCHWTYSGNEELINEDFSHNKWPPFETAKLYLMSPLALKHDIEKVIYAQIEIYASGREIAGKRDKDKLRYNAICEACEYYTRHESNQMTQRTRVHGDVLSHLNEANVNTYAFFCAINYAVSEAAHLQHMNVKDLLENAITAYGVFNIMKNGPKTNMPYSLKAIQLNIQTLIDEQIDSALKRKNATVYCEKTQIFIDRLIDRSFIGQKYLGNMKQCMKTIEPEDFDFSQFLTEEESREHTRERPSVIDTLPILL